MSSWHLHVDAKNIDTQINQVYLTIMFSKWNLPHKHIINAKKGVASLSNAFFAQAVKVEVDVVFSSFSPKGLSLIL